VSDRKERAFKFSTLQLPGQPQMMHMGTANLVSDLSARITELEQKVVHAHRLIHNCLLELPSSTFKVKTEAWLKKELGGLAAR